MLKEDQDHQAGMPGARGLNISKEARHKDKFAKYACNEHKFLQVKCTVHKKNYNQNNKVRTYNKLPFRVSESSLLC